MEVGPVQFKKKHILAAALAAAIFGPGCATDSASMARHDAKIDALMSRVEDVERTNGRLTVRLEEMEDSLFLLNDRVESHRIALQRRGYMRNPAVAYKPQAPDQAPETYYRPGATDGYSRPQPSRPVKRIALGGDSQDYEDPNAAYNRAVSEDDGKQEHVVITQKEYREYFGEDPAPAARSTGGGSTGRAQPNVTTERLATSKRPQPAKSSNAAPTPTPSDSADDYVPTKTGLAAYKEALADYRAGRFARALKGFESFLEGGPKADYVDNALYWIGECHYGLGHFDQAVSNFERVMSEQPEGNKVPDAMLKMSLALDRLGQRDRSSDVLKKLSERYPMTNAGRLGLKKLESR
jgi:tol-pal system protein YbgF